MLFYNDKCVIKFGAKIIIILKTLTNMSVMFYIKNDTFVSENEETKTK